MTMDKNKFNKYLKKMKSLRKRDIDGFYHSHHILPKSLGGSDDRDNMVKLTIPEHIDAHLELADCFDVGSSERNMNLSAANVLHSWIGKESGIDLSGENNPMWGKKHSHKTKKLIGEKSSQKQYSPEYKQKLSVAMMGSKNHRYGVKMSSETKEKIGESQRGEKHHLWGKKRSKETRENIGLSQPNRIVVSKYDLEGNKLDTYTSLGEAAKNNQITQGNLSTYFSKGSITKFGSYRVLGGFVWKKEEI